MTFGATGILVSDFVWEFLLLTGALEQFSPSSQVNFPAPIPSPVPDVMVVPEEFEEPVEKWSREELAELLRMLDETFGTDGNV